MKRTHCHPFSFRLIFALIEDMRALNITYDQVSLDTVAVEVQSLGFIKVIVCTVVISLSKMRLGKVVRGQRLVPWIIGGNRPSK